MPANRTTPLTPLRIAHQSSENEQMSPIERMPSGAIAEIAKFLPEESLLLENNDSEKKNYFTAYSVTREIAIQRLIQTKKFEFKCSNEADIASLKRLLKNMPNLKELKISGLSPPCT
jgi:hypothetical protein